MSGAYVVKRLLHEELKKANVDIAVIPETKKKLKGSARAGRLYFSVQWCPNE